MQHDSYWWVLRLLLGLVVGGVFVVFSSTLLRAQVHEDVELHRALSDGGCNLCHQVPGFAVAPRTDSCSGCHVWIRKIAADPNTRQKAMQVFPKWERYERNVATYMAVPDLNAAIARLDADWVRNYLEDPHDLRPSLPETMPRLGLSAADLNRISELFDGSNRSWPQTPSVDEKRVSEGAALFSSKGCVACHAFGDLHPGSGLPQSPDLAHTRDRMTNDAVVAWILDPKAVAPSATMPSLGLSTDEAVAIRDYLILSTLSWSDAPKVGADPKPTSEPVTYAQVEERVFGKICVHCHMDPAQNEGRAGPGNAGGFGWKATGIELQTMDGIRAVADRIGPSLLRRRHEMRRDFVGPGIKPASLERPERPGMPLGLPPIPDEDISLVLGWIEQGMPE